MANPMRYRYVIVGSAGAGCALGVPLEERPTVSLWTPPLIRSPERIDDGEYDYGGPKYRPGLW